MLNHGALKVLKYRINKWQTKTTNNIFIYVYFPVMIWIKPVFLLFPILKCSVKVLIVISGNLTLALIRVLFIHCRLCCTQQRMISVCWTCRLFAPHFLYYILVICMLQTSIEIANLRPHDKKKWYNLIVLLTYLCLENRKKSNLICAATVNFIRFRSNCEKFPTCIFWICFPVCLVR